MDQEKRKQITLRLAIIVVILTAIGILKDFLSPLIQRSSEMDDSILAAFMVCENWKLPCCVESEVESLNIAQSTDANQMSIKNVLKIKSMDHLLIYNKGSNPVPELYVTIPDSEYGEIVKGGKIIDKFEDEVIYKPLGKLFVEDDVQVRVWRKCYAKSEDSERGVVIHRGKGRGHPPKISFLFPSVVDFDNWVKKLVESKNNSLFIYLLLSGFGFMVLLLTVLLWNRRRKRRTTIAT